MSRPAATINPRCSRSSRLPGDALGPPDAAETRRTPHPCRRQRRAAPVLRGTKPRSRDSGSRTTDSTSGTRRRGEEQRADRQRVLQAGDGIGDGSLSCLQLGLPCHSPGFAHCTAYSPARAADRTAARASHNARARKVSPDSSTFFSTMSRDPTHRKTVPASARGCQSRAEQRAYTVAARVVCGSQRTTRLRARRPPATSRRGATRAPCCRPSAPSPHCALSNRRRSSALAGALRVRGCVPPPAPGRSAG